MSRVDDRGSSGRWFMKMKDFAAAYSSIRFIAVEMVGRDVQQYGDVRAELLDFLQLERN